MATVLEQIERAAETIASQHAADVRLERDDRGKAPCLAIRALGKVQAHDAPVELGRDM